MRCPNIPTGLVSEEAEWEARTFIPTSWKRGPSPMVPVETRGESRPVPQPGGNKASLLLPTGFCQRRTGRESGLSPWPDNKVTPPPTPCLQVRRRNSPSVPPSQGVFREGLVGSQNSHFYPAVIGAPLPWVPVKASWETRTSISTWQE